MIDYVLSEDEYNSMQEELRALRRQCTTQALELQAMRERPNVPDGALIASERKLQAVRDCMLEALVYEHDPRPTVNLACAVRDMVAVLREQLAEAQERCKRYASDIASMEVAYTETCQEMNKQREEVVKAVKNQELTHRRVAHLTNHRDQIEAQLQAFLSLAKSIEASQ